MNWRLAGPTPELVSPDEPLYLLLSANQAPRFLSRAVPELSW
jgi:hypothetical protein